MIFKVSSSLPWWAGFSICLFLPVSTLLFLLSGPHTPGLAMVWTLPGMPDFVTLTLVANSAQVVLMPLLALWLLLLVQVAFFARDRIDLQGAARDAARAASVAPPSERLLRATSAAQSGTHLDVGVDLVVTVHTVTATLHLREHATMPLVGALVPDIDMTARATMPLDPPTQALVRQQLWDGAAVVGLDVDRQITSLHDRAEFLGLRCDVTEPAALRASLEAAARALRYRLIGAFAAIATAAFRPEQLKPTQEDPADFDDFWNAGKAALAKLTIDAGVTSNVFRAGHRIRIEISSSNCPRFDRNPNTGDCTSTPQNGGACGGTGCSRFSMC